MKKTLIFIISLLFAVEAYGQFKMTPLGMKTEGKKKDYYVLEYPGKTQKEIFESAVFFMMSEYPSRHNMMNVVEFESVGFNVMARNAVIDGKSVTAPQLDMQYNVRMDFKDGKLRIWPPVIKRIGKRNGSSNETLLISPLYRYGDVPFSLDHTVIYNKNGRLKRKHAKKSIEKYFGELTKELDRYISSKGDDW